MIQSLLHGQERILMKLIEMDEKQKQMENKIVKIENRHSGVIDNETLNGETLEGHDNVKDELSGPFVLFCFPSAFAFHPSL